MSERVLLLIGSPGNLRSNSNQLGQYLVGRLGDAGWDVDTECVCQAVRGEDRMRSVMDKIDGSDLVILSFPLYVDSLPAPMIRFLEIVNDHRKGVEKMDQRMMAVCQSGFPESHYNDCALRVCSIFARDSGFRWIGGLAVGGGGAIGGKAFKRAGPCCAI